MTTLQFYLIIIHDSTSYSDVKSLLEIEDSPRGRFPTQMRCIGQGSIVMIWNGRSSIWPKYLQPRLLSDNDTRGSLSATIILLPSELTADLVHKGRSLGPKTCPRTLGYAFHKAS